MASPTSRCSGESGWAPWAGPLRVQSRLHHLLVSEARRVGVRCLLSSLQGCWEASLGSFKKPASAIRASSRSALGVVATWGAEAVPGNAGQEAPVCLEF